MSVRRSTEFRHSGWKLNFVNFGRSTFAAFATDGPNLENKIITIVQAEAKSDTKP